MKSFLIGVVVFASILFAFVFFGSDKANAAIRPIVEKDNFDVVCAKTLKNNINVRTAKQNIRILEPGKDGVFLELANGAMFIADYTKDPIMYGMQQTDGTKEQCILAQ